MKLKFKNVIIEPVGVCDIYEVGHWTKYYSCIKLGYLIEDYDSKYFDIIIGLKKDNIFLGYFMAYSIINTDNNDDIISLYSKKMVIYDFAVFAKAYAKYGKLLIEYMLVYAKKNGFSAIEIKKINQYSFFIDFLNRHYKLKEYNNSLYFIVDPIIKKSEKHLRIYENDVINIDDLYFLYDLKFKVNKTNIVKKIDNDNHILIDRRSGIISFPKNVKMKIDNVILNNQTRNILYLLQDMYPNNIEDVYINYSKDKSYFYEIYINDCLYVNIEIEKLTKDINYLLKMKQNDINKIYSYFIGYDMNDRVFSQSFGGMEIDNLIDKYAANCDSKAANVIEKIQEKKRMKRFNVMLQSIKRFDFQFGNSFCGTKKLSINFSDSLDIHSNGRIEKEINPNREEIIKELSNFYFSNWEEKYVNKINPKPENAWSIRLIFENDTLEFMGIDDYPNVWEYVKWFIEKYSKFSLVEE